MSIDSSFGRYRRGATHTCSIIAGTISDGDAVQHGARLDDSERVLLVLTTRSCPNAIARRHPRCLKGLTGNFLPPNPPSTTPTCADFRCCCCCCCIASPCATEQNARPLTRLQKSQHRRSPPLSHISQISLWSGPSLLYEQGRGGERRGARGGAIRRHVSGFSKHKTYTLRARFAPGR